MSPGLSVVVCTVTIMLAMMVSFTQGGCEFKKSWIGRWFLSGVPNLLYINLTHIETKGECYEELGDKYLIYDKTEDCYRCMAIHEKHPNVLQYKETFCNSKASLQEICYDISGDAPLYSMFRKYQEAKPVTCPFRNVPFTFSYNKGLGNCSNPPSMAESCTDDSKLVLKYQACPDIASTERNVEELVCLATWKDGLTRYLMGRISQRNRQNLVLDEDQYRCFIYQRNVENGKTVYNIAQSGDATCNGLQNAFEGNRTMKLTTVNNHIYRCKFPAWITEHRTWWSLDHHKTLRFSQRNSTLQILNEHSPKLNKIHQNYTQPSVFQEFGFEPQDQRRQNSEMRVVCHSIVLSQEHKKFQIVAHIATGCDSGYVCMMFYKRDSNVIELQQSENYVEYADEACANFSPTKTPYTTSHLSTSSAVTEKRKKRQQPGGCEFKKSWIGRWFLSGVPNLLYINLTHIETKGECYEEQGDKYLIYDKTEDCYRCMAIHEKHPSVLQYKETFCDSKASLQEICYDISGDAPLYSMFRKHPEAKPVPCPFKSAPFTFSYNKGSGDCSNPPSKAESCTDDSRLVLKYQACPDISSTESNVEELVCLATWKEGSTRYLMGRISQGNRRNLVLDEDQYRCFIYQRNAENGKAVYNIAQSGDATCNGLQNAFEGSRTMKLTTVDNHHNRCKFPVWITEHHTWLSLDHHKTYRFSQRNATLKILDGDSPKLNKIHQNYAQPFGFQEFGFESQDQRRQNSEMRVVCHSIVLSQEHKKVQIVAHITAGCDSGYVCMMFYKRDSNVIELQQSENYVEIPEDACANFSPTKTPYTTLITTTLHTKKCPHLGRYTLSTSSAATEKRKKRQQPDGDSAPNQLSPDCYSHNYEALAVGCGGSHAMEFRSACAQQSVNEYSCHGSWEENGVSYVITSQVARKSPDARYCFIYTLSNQPETTVIEGSLGKRIEPPILRLSSVSESCHRHIIPGVTGNWAFNFTSNGTCAVDFENSSSIAIPALAVVLSSALIALVLR